MRPSTAGPEMPERRLRARRAEDGEGAPWRGNMVSVDDDARAGVAAVSAQELPQWLLGVALLSLVVLCCWSQNPGQLPNRWWQISLALVTLRLVLPMAWLRWQVQAPAILVTSGLAALLVLPSLPWAALPWLYFGSWTLAGQLVASLCMVALLVATNPWFTWLPRAAMAHAVVLLLPCSVWWLAHGPATPRWIGAGLLGCLAAGIAAGVQARRQGLQRRAHERVLKSLTEREARSAQQVERLVVQLGEAQKAAEAGAVAAPSVVEEAAVKQHAQDLEQRSRDLAAQAVTDSLTGLPNRKGINEHLNELLAPNAEAGQEPTMALLFLDLDHFKEVNDLMGHLAGDSVLQVVAERLRESMPRGAFAARWGGDEFVVVLPGTRRAEHAKRVAEHLRAALSVPVQLQERVARIGCSVGIALAPQHGGTPEALIIAADHAVYSAKSEGSGRVRLYDATLAEAAGRQHEIAQALPVAVELGQLAVAYQPIVSAEDGHATHVEALARWRHPHWGVVSPAEFIPVAEASGLIHVIGRWVLRQACLDAARWPGRNPPKVSVNVSAMQVTGGRLIAQVREALAAASLPASRLVLELTESLPMAGREGVDATLKELRSLGVTLAIDDFGTGYSSMISLKNQPLSLIKVDRSFVQDVPGEGELLIKATVEVARCFGLQVVAEGVENRAQQLRLRALGVDYMQGYHFGRPMPNHEFVAWMALRDDSELSVALRA